MTGSEDCRNLDAVIMYHNDAEKAARNVDGIQTAFVDTGSTGMVPPGFVKGILRPPPTPETAQQMWERLTTRQKLTVNSPKMALTEDARQYREVSSPADGAPGTSQGATVK